MAKPPLSLIPVSALMAEAAAFADGADKYGAYDYLQRPMLASANLDAALRHILAWNAGEDCASDSNVHHLGHARARLGMILHAMAHGNLVDDRQHVRFTGCSPRLSLSGE
jgi:hypothetical protein